jgi:hypothetical protein
LRKLETTLVAIGAFLPDGPVAVEQAVHSIAT